MIDTSKLSHSLIDGIVSNLGWKEDQPIEPYLEQIAQLTPEQALSYFAEWHLGDGSWATLFIEYIDQLRKADQ